MCDVCIIGEPLVLILARLNSPLKGATSLPHLLHRQFDFNATTIEKCLSKNGLE